MLNVNSYNVKYRVLCVAHKLIPFHKTRRSQSPPGARPHAGTSSHGSGQRPIRCPSYDRCLLPCLACLALQCHATPRNALPRHAMPCRAPLSLDASASFPPTSCAGGGYENCCLEFCCGLVSEPMLPPRSPFAPLLGPPSPRGLSSHHQSNGPLSSFPGGLLFHPPYRYGLHAAQTSFLRPGLPLSGWCAGVVGVRLPGVVKNTIQM